VKELEATEDGTMDIVMEELPLREVPPKTRFAS